MRHWEELENVWITRDADGRAWKITAGVDGYRLSRVKRDGLGSIEVGRFDRLSGAQVFVEGLTCGPWELEELEELVRSMLLHAYRRHGWGGRDPLNPEQAGETWRDLWVALDLGLLLHSEEEQAMRPKGERMYSVRFFVRGAGAFPFDMLRYDSCFPVFEGESRKMGEDGLRTVELEQRRPVGALLGPTEGRWRSFGWRASLSRQALEET